MKIAKDAKKGPIETAETERIHSDATKATKINLNRQPDTLIDSFLGSLRASIVTKGVAKD
jgi:hypothetical protein